MIKAGYSKSEIAEINSEKEQPAESIPDEQPQAEPVPEEKPEESAAPAIDPRIDAISGELKDLKNMMAKFFISNDSFEQSKKNIAADVLANVINPQRD